MTIYEIDAAILALVDENGEITDIEALDALTMERDKKVEAVACWIKNDKAEAEAIRAEELALADRRHVLENNIERLKGYLAYALQGQKFETPKCSVSWRRVKAADIDEEQCMAFITANQRDDLLTYSEPKLARKAITDALKAGEQIDGATLVERVSAQIK